MLFIPFSIEETKLQYPIFALHYPTPDALGQSANHMRDHICSGYRMLYEMLAHGGGSALDENMRRFQTAINEEFVQQADLRFCPYTERSPCWWYALSAKQRPWL